MVSRRGKTKLEVKEEISHRWEKSRIDATK